MRYIFILLALLCVSCGTALPTVKPYKLDVQQGNVVTSKMLLQLRPGMTKSQVRFIMGTPLIQDSFHGNRWDYVYQMREGGKIKEQRRVILDFENELLKTVRGDVVAQGSDQSKATDEAAPTGTRVVTPVKKPEDKGLLDKLKFWEKDEVELAKDKADKEAAVKAKLDAEASAKKVALEPVKDSTPAVAPVVVEEPKSILAVPLEVPALADAPVVAPVAESPQQVTPAVEAVKVEPEPVVTAPPAPVQVEQAVEARPAAPVAMEPAEPPAKSPYYQSPSGMQFDRQLQFELEEEPKPAAVGPRSGNKVAPKPKELPQESDPSFFDRMLEKIGF